MISPVDHGSKVVTRFPARLPERELKSSEKTACETGLMKAVMLLMTKSLSDTANQLRWCYTRPMLHAVCSFTLTKGLPGCSLCFIHFYFISKHQMFHTLGQSAHDPGVSLQNKFNTTFCRDGFTSGLNVSLIGVLRCKEYEPWVPMVGEGAGGGLVWGLR